MMLEATRADACGGGGNRPRAPHRRPRAPDRRGAVDGRAAGPALSGMRSPRSSAPSTKAARARSRRAFTSSVPASWRASRPRRPQRAMEAYAEEVETARRRSALAGGRGHGALAAGHRDRHDLRPWRSSEPAPSAGLRDHPLVSLPPNGRTQRYRLRAPASGREVVLALDNSREATERAYYDRVTGERLEVVSKLVPLASSPSNLPRTPETLRICPHCERARRAGPERLPLLQAPPAGAGQRLLGAVRPRRGLLMTPAMRRVALIAVAAVLTGVLAGVVLAGGGDDNSSNDTVKPPELTVPGGSGRAQRRWRDRQGRSQRRDRAHRVLRRSGDAGPGPEHRRQRRAPGQPRQNDIPPPPRQPRGQVREVLLAESRRLRAVTARG